MTGHDLGHPVLVLDLYELVCLGKGSSFETVILEVLDLLGIVSEFALVAVGLP